jgi:hypothetical protein
MNPVLLLAINAFVTTFIANVGGFGWWQTPVWVLASVLIGAAVAFGGGYFVHYAHYSTRGPATMLTLLIAAFVGLLLIVVRPYVLAF